MPVYALYNLNDAGTEALDSATGNGAQNGIYLNGAASDGTRAVLDGQNDLVKIYSSDEFQLDRGTLEIKFTTTQDGSDETQTVLSRDSTGETDGGFRIQRLADGTVQITHETADGGNYVFSTDAGFAGVGELVKVTYSWDEATGGQVIVENFTDGTADSGATPAGLTMDQGDNSQPWMIGAGQQNSDPDTLNNVDEHFGGTVEYFQLSDTVDTNPPVDPDRDGYVDGTSGGDFIDGSYTGDPDGDLIDNDDALLPGAVDNDDFVRAGAGNDTVWSNDGNDTVNAGSGNDSVHSGYDDDSIGGGYGDDTLVGGGGSDLVYGGIGNDVIGAGSETDSFPPLPDQDYPGLYPADSDPTDDLDTVYGGIGHDTIYTGDDADVIYGGSGRDSIDAGIDDDTIMGGQGGDTIIGGEGSDLIDGGNSHDVIYGGYGPDAPDALNIPDETDLRPDNARDTIMGGEGNDTIFGMDDADELHGGVGRDSLNGGIDNDTIFGDAGRDTLVGGHGIDSLSGGDDRDLFIVDDAGEGAGDVIDGGAGGRDWDTMDLTGAGRFEIVDRVTDSDGNGFDGTVNFLDADGNVTGSMTFTNIEDIVPCFTPGTMIATPRGEIPVEELKAGDRVITRDNGIQQIRWVGQKALSWADLSLNPHLKPVLIRRGSLGNGLPERDMMVSPNHRVLVANDRTALYFDEHEVLVAAKHLVAGKGVHEVDSMGTTYIHFMFDRHEVVLSNGAWTESFQPGDYSLKGLGNAQRNEIFELFPDLKTEEGRENFGAARRTLKRHEALLLAK